MRLDKTTDRGSFGSKVVAHDPLQVGSRDWRPSRRRRADRIDDQPRIAPAKTMVIDGEVTLMGSYNWLAGAAKNSEDLNLVSFPTVAAAYAAHWRERFAVSVRF